MNELEQRILSAQNAYYNGEDPDFAEYCRFLADWGGIDFDEEIEWVD